MTDLVNRRIILAARPHGDPKPSDFDIVTSPVPVAQEGQVLVRNHLLSIDPFNRILMGNANSDQEPIAVGDTMFSFAVGVVEHSNHPEFAVGDHVSGFLGTLGWQDYAISDGTDIRVVDPEVVALSTHLGALGVTGLTAWVGLTKVSTPQSSGTLLVTAAAGAVGSAAAQIGKLRGQRVVGVAGGPAKTRYLLDELGLDAAVDYKADDFEEQLARALPDGADTIYENVGASQLPIVLRHARDEAQVIVGGVMSQITATGAPTRPDQLPDVLKTIFYRDLSVRGFNVTKFYDAYPEFLADITPAVADGRFVTTTHLVEGLENIPTIFPEMFTGRVAGKMVAKIA